MKGVIRALYDAGNNSRKYRSLINDVYRSEYPVIDGRVMMVHDLQRLNMAGWIDINKDVQIHRYSLSDSAREKIDSIDNYVSEEDSLKILGNDYIICKELLEEMQVN